MEVLLCGLSSCGIVASTVESRFHVIFGVGISQPEWFWSLFLSLFQAQLSPHLVPCGSGVPPAFLIHVSRAIGMDSLCAPTPHSRARDARHDMLAFHRERPRRIRSAAGSAKLLEIVAQRISSAASKLTEQYRARLCQLVEREMNSRFRRKEDPEDVVQSAFRTFYRRNALGEFHIDSSVDLWRLLETITWHKMLKHVEKLSAGKRDPKREEYPEGDDL